MCVHVMPTFSQVLSLKCIIVCLCVCAAYSFFYIVPILSVSVFQSNIYYSFGLAVCILIPFMVCFLV